MFHERTGVRVQVFKQRTDGTLALSLSLHHSLPPGVTSAAVADPGGVKQPWRGETFPVTERQHRDVDHFNKFLLSGLLIAATTCGGYFQLATAD